MRQEDVLQGSTVRADAQFEDPATGLPMTVVEPVTLQRRRPNGTDPGNVAMVLITVPAGDDPDLAPGPAYRAVFNADAAGTWLLKAVSSGAEPAVVDGSVDVRASPF